MGFGGIFICEKEIWEGTWGCAIEVPCLKSSSLHYQLKPFDMEVLDAVLEVNRLLNICVYVTTIIHTPPHPCFHSIPDLIGNKSSILDGS